MEVYEQFPKGAKLSSEILNRSEQIVRMGEWLVLTIDISEDLEHYDPHVIVFEDDALAGACYLPSQHIVGKGNEIWCVENEWRLNRTERYGCDLPGDLILRTVPGKKGRSEWKKVARVTKFSVPNLDSISLTAEGEIAGKISTFSLEQLHFSPRDHEVFVFRGALENPERRLHFRFENHSMFEAFQREIFTFVLTRRSENER